MKYGVSNHRMEHYSFIKPAAGLMTDLENPATADFSSVAGRSPEAYQRFLADWVARNKELIDKYQPDALYFDNGVNSRSLDPQKLAGWHFLGRPGAVDARYRPVAGREWRGDLRHSPLDQIR